MFFDLLVSNKPNDRIEDRHGNSIAFAQAIDEYARLILKR